MLIGEIQKNTMEKIRVSTVTKNRNRYINMNKKIKIYSRSGAFSIFSLLYRYNLYLFFFTKEVYING